MHSTIIWDIHILCIPQTVSVGGALAIAGAVFQSVFQASFKTLLWNLTDGYAPLHCCQRLRRFGRNNNSLII
ncbi:MULTISPECIES: hypothetical protein [unclassified Methanosarcina]|uniref:hypothetical protein n=1 Tax=unclassified Methanosarcina TaxID=2644672 RepID=UPI0018CF194E|nr:MULTISPECIES: hypothetical protein [unclassified Methanosarcina]